MTSTRKIVLKGGFLTSDTRLDRLPAWDDRNHKYLIRTLITPEEAQKPRSYTWSLDNLYDQGVEGRCVEYAICHELRARGAGVGAGAGVVDQRFIDDILYGRKIYWPAQRMDYWPGGSYPGASPYYEGTSVLHGMLAARDLGVYEGFNWALTLDDFILGIGYKGPGVIGVNFYDDMFTPDSNGFVEPGTSALAGGHALCVNKVNMREEYFGLPQSWGRRHGKNGFIKIRFSTMERLLREDGEFCLPTGRRTP